MWSLPAESSRVAAVTIDVHADDRAEDIHTAANLLATAGIRATFFVPGALFHASKGIAAALRELPRLKHEVASHGYAHNWREVDALMRGVRSDLTFLTAAHSEFADFYGVSPKAFRSPVWCRLSDIALDELIRLGYQVDSSATPQRVQMLSSRPFCRGWMLSRRSPYLIRSRMLEVPTTAAVLQAGSTTFRLIGRTLSLFFVRLLLAEAALFPGRVVVLQFDSRDLNHNAEQQHPRRWEFRDYLMRGYGGFGFRRHLLEYDPVVISATTWAVLRMVTQARTMSEVRTAWLASRPQHTRVSNCSEP
jgi:hypothetical protein